MLASFPRHIAGCHVFRRLSMPRHPPCTLNNLTTITDRRLYRLVRRLMNSPVPFGTNEITAAKGKPGNGAIPSGRAWKSPSVATPLGTELKPKPVEVKWHDSPKRCLIFADAASRKDTLYPPGQGITSRKRCRSDAGRRTPFDNLIVRITQAKGLCYANSEVANNAFSDLAYKPFHLP